MNEKTAVLEALIAEKDFEITMLKSELRDMTNSRAFYQDLSEERNKAIVFLKRQLVRIAYKLALSAVMEQTHGERNILAREIVANIGRVRSMLYLEMSESTDNDDDIPF